MSTVQSTLEHLFQAQQLVESDNQHTPQVVRTVFALASDRSQAPEIHQWCSLFLVNAFTVYHVDQEIRQQLAVEAIDPVNVLLEITDPMIAKNAVTIAATIYAMVFFHVCRDQTQERVWTKLVEMKKKCIAMWDDPLTFGVHAACIKFGQQVIKVQTYGTRDPRLVNSDVSLSTAPAGHRLIDRSLEAEAKALLDRMLVVFYEDHIFSPVLTCTINAVYLLIKYRPLLESTIFRAILSFDSQRKSTIEGSSELRQEMEFRFVDKSLKLMLTSYLKRISGGRYTSQVQQFLSTLSQGRASEKLKKRIAQSEHEDESHKRVRLERRTTPVNSQMVLPPGPASYTSLYSLIAPDDPLVSFDAQELPVEIALNLALAGITTANDQLLNRSVDIVRARYQDLKKRAPTQPTSDMMPIDSYENEDDVYMNNYDDRGRRDMARKLEEESEDEEEGGLMPASEFSLPEPKKLEPRDREQAMVDIIERLISYSTTKIEAKSAPTGTANRGVNRVAVTEWSKDTWAILATRVLTRGICASDSGVADTIRDHLFKYVMGNFRERLDVLVTWMTEEWFNEFVVSDTAVPKDQSSYFKWVNKLLEQILPLMEVTDMKGFLRLLSDLPELDKQLISKIKGLCIDPTRAKVGFKGLQFLIMLRPPCKEFTLDFLEELYTEDKDSREHAGPLLKRFRGQTDDDLAKLVQ
ncbi:pre-tRNA-processing protein Pta1p [Trichomonascus vanleenenianus]|uniref:RNA-processing protein PTA1 n=1 Tax=Trichomonascus vanleenenianus TaxID=2268995 RepID=UPI003ECA34D6